MRSKMPVALGGFFVIALLLSLLIRERWTTPADELKTILGFYRTLAAEQQVYFRTYHRYAGFQELLGAGSGKYRLHSACQDLLCFEVFGSDTKYSIKIFPNRRMSPVRHVSLYADEKGVVRMAYGPPEAHAESTALSHEEMRRFQEE